MQNTFGEINEIAQPEAHEDKHEEMSGLKELISSYVAKFDQNIFISQTTNLRKALK